MLNSSPNLNLSLTSLYNHVCPHAHQCRNIHTTMVSDSESYWIWSYRKFHTHVFTLILDSNTLSRHKDTQAHFILCKISSWIFVRAWMSERECLGIWRGKCGVDFPRAERVSRERNMWRGDRCASEKNLLCKAICNLTFKKWFRTKDYYYYYWKWRIHPSSLFTYTNTKM